MLDVVTSRNANLYGPALDDMFRLRHRILVEKRGLSRLRRPDGRLKDRFDTDDAIHLLLFGKDGALHGAERLLPTTGPHLFSDVAGDLCSVRGIPRGPGIVELTRYCVDEEELPRPALETAGKLLVVGLVEFCQRAGYEKITMLLPADVLFYHLVMGVDIKPLGLSVQRDGIEQVAVQVDVTQRTLNALRLALDVFEPVVRYAGAPDGDPLVLAPARVPELSRVAAE
jgi:acyl-homoserine lactone synthase